jgi:Uma2 family endonuclease
MVVVSILEVQKSADIIYPDSDGEPMSDNTKQFRWITVIHHNLEWLFAKDENVFVAGDLLWYPVEGNNQLCQAPDVMVVFGAKKGDRGSYMQWREGNIAPQVAFEILSPSNTLTKMNRKQSFYNRYGVEEYYLYDPDKNDLSGWLRGEEGLDVIENMADWISPRLGIRFDLSQEVLQLFRPDGVRFTSYSEISQQLSETSQQLSETSQQLSETSQQLSETSQQLETALQNLEVVLQDKEQERQRAQRLAERLRAMGVDPDSID